MARPALYSRARRLKREAEETAAVSEAMAFAASTAASSAPPPKGWRRWLRRPTRAGLAAGILVAVVAALAAHTLFAAKPRQLTQRDIDQAVLHTLKKQPPAPARSAVANAIIRPSLVLVRSYGKPGEDDKDAKKEKGKAEPKPVAPAEKEQAKKEPPTDQAKKDPADKAAPEKDFADKGEKEDGRRGLGSGVVVSEEGLIATCLHVIAGAERIMVSFSDGSESEADVVSVKPEDDLAILKARVIPDDLQAATLRSTRGLNIGDEVIAVGFPFGIGASTSSGVVSALRREYQSQDGKRRISNLIQFDAAANPGNSGGPLVTAEGDVVGIVTSILNPTDKGFFIGIAFAVPIENAASAAGLSPF